MFERRRGLTLPVFCLDGRSLASPRARAGLGARALAGGWIVITAGRAIENGYCLGALRNLPHLLGNSSTET